MLNSMILKYKRKEINFNMGIKITEDVKVHDVSKKVVGTQISHDLYLKLKSEADDEFMSISDLLRKIIFKYYNDRKEIN